MKSRLMVDANKQSKGDLKMNKRIIEDQRAEAVVNSSKSIEELKVGDFIYLDAGYLKNEGFIEAVADMALEDCYHSGRLSRIEKIVHCTESDMFSNKFEFGEGGSSSDVFESMEEIQKINFPDISEFFYTKVTLVIADSGKFAFVNAEGYDYPRYISLYGNWREMYSKEIEEERIAREERERLRKEEEDRKREALKAEHQKEITEKWGFLDPKKTLKANWVAACKAFFDFPVKVSKHSDYYRRECIVLTCQNDEECQKVREFVREAEINFQYCTGEYGYRDDGYEHLIYRNSIEEIVPGFFYDVTVQQEYK